MVSHSNLTKSLPTPSNALPTRYRWLLGTALGLSALSLTASGMLFTQMRSLEQKIQDVATVSGSSQEHTVLKSQVASLNKELQTQTKRVTELTQGISSTKQSVTQLSQDMTKLNMKIDAVKQPTQANVNIGVSEPQEIGHGFWVTDLIAIPDGQGTRLVGNLVNSSSVKYTDILFNVRIGNKPAKMLSIAAIAGGSHASFKLDFPDIPVDQATKGRIDYVSANLLMLTGEE